MARNLDKPIYPTDWNNTPDPLDAKVWDVLVSNFWVPEKIPLSNDIKSWESLREHEKEAVKKVFAGLTLLDTIQGEYGAPSIMKHVQERTAGTPDGSQELACLSNIQFMEAFRGDTLVLTDQGWLPISQVTLDTLVAQYTDNNEIEFVHPTAITAPFTAGVSWEFSGAHGRGRQVVTQGHRLVWKNQDGELVDILARDAAVALAMGKADSSSVVLAPRGGSGEINIEQAVLVLLYQMFFDGKTSRVRCADGVAAREISQLCDKFGTQCEIVEEAGSSPSVIISGVIESVSLRRVLPLGQTCSNDFLSVVERVKIFVGMDNMQLGFGTVDAALDAVACATAAGVAAHFIPHEDSGAAVAFDTATDYPAQELNVTPHEELVAMFCIQVPSTKLVTFNPGANRDQAATPVISGNCVHAKSYSSIFMTLISSLESDEVLHWAVTDEYMRAKQDIIRQCYDDTNELHVRAASVLLESFLFYSGFYLPLYLSAHGKLTNTADIIRLILRDEQVHGYYIGYHYQKLVEKLDDQAREEQEQWVYDLLLKLYDNEIGYTQSIYDDLKLTEDVKRFLRYNANKALNNLGYEQMFPTEETNVSPAVLTALSTHVSETHDFFSGSGSSYVMGKAEATDDEDWIL